jgi:hypothetical protein
VTYEYPGFLAVYENREGNAQSMFEKSGGILLHRTLGTMFLDRGGYRIVPEKGSSLAPSELKSTNGGNREHWANFLDCVKTREKPTSDIEKCQHSTTTCLLGKVALRSKLRLDFRCPEVDGRRTGREEISVSRISQALETGGLRKGRTRSHGPLLGLLHSDDRTA